MEQSKSRTFVIHEFTGRFAIVRLNPESEVPSWAWKGSLCAVVRTGDELAIVCDQNTVPGDVRSERDWVALRIEGPLPLSSTGVLASLLGPLASMSIAVFAISTFDTDYILVKADRAQLAREILTAEGHHVS
jgi:hypothetical protein